MELPGRIFYQHGGALGDAVQTPREGPALEGELHARADDEAGMRGTLAASKHRMSVAAMLEKTRGDVLEARFGAGAPFPAEEFGQVNDFVLEDALQRVEPVCAANAANGHIRIGLAEAVKENAGPDGDLKDLAGAGQIFEGLPTRLRHARRKAEPQRPALKRRAAVAREEPLVVRVEQELRVACVDCGEVLHP